MARLLVGHHSPTASVRALTQSVLAGARDDAIEGVAVSAVTALEAVAEDVLAVDGIVLITPANFGYMSGALKHFFDSTFLRIGGSLGADGKGAAATGARLPYALCVHGRYDTTGAVRSVQAIVGALPWRQAAPVLEVMGEVDHDALEAAHEVGATLAAVLS